MTTSATDKIEIRCTRATRKQFKKVAADFDSYDHVLMWLIENYEYFKTLRSPDEVASRKTMMEHGVL